MKTSTDDLETKLQKLRQSTQAHVQELKKALDLRVSRTNLISYFTYSLNITHHLQWDTICLASYHITNIGEAPLTNPEIILTLSEESPFSLHGKYLNSGAAMPLKLKDGWERLNDPSNTKEFKLKPIGKTGIQPGETITFSNFQISWLPTEEYSGSVTGRTFTDQHPEGEPALNIINMNGTLQNGTEEDDNE